MAWEERSRRENAEGCRVAGDGLATLGLSARAHNALRRHGVRSVQALCLLTPPDVLALQNVGPGTLADIESRLAAVGLALASAPHDLPADRSAEGRPPARFFAGASSPQALCPALASSRVPISHLDLNRRAYMCLARAGVHTVGKLASMSEQALLAMRGMGSIGVANVRAGLDMLRATTERGSVPLTDDSIAMDHAGDARPVDVFSVGPETSQMLASRGCATEIGSFEDVLHSWLDAMSSRNQQIMCRNLGIGCEASTLEETGDLFGLTRERVRQITARELWRFGHGPRGMVLATQASRAAELVRRAGGIMTSEEVGAQLSVVVPLGNVRPCDAAMLLASLSDELTWWHSEGILAAAEFERENLSALWADLEAAWADVCQPVSADDIVFHVAASWVFRDEGVTQDTVRAALRCHPRLSVNDGSVVWAGSGHTYVRGAKEETIAAMRRIGRPAHYTEIASMVAELRGDRDAPSERTIHQRLSNAGGDFVRVGRGVYGLAEWGLPDDGCVANAVVRVLEEAGSPLSLAQIQDAVQATWQVTGSSVAQALYSDERVASTERGYHGLVTWNESRQGRMTFSYSTDTGKR